MINMMSRREMMRKWAKGTFHASTMEALRSVFSDAQIGTIQAWAKTADQYLIDAINQFAVEDPRIMCSLVSGLPIRSIVLDGTAYAWTKNKANQNTFMSFKGTVTANKTGGGEKWHTLFGCDNSATSNAFGIWVNDTAGGGTLIEWGSVYGLYANMALNRRFYAEMDKNVTTIKYVGSDTPVISKTHSTATFTTPSNVGLFMLIRGSGPISVYDGYLVGTCEEVISKQDGVLSEHYIPFKRNGVMELLDLVSGTLATRVGSFTELIETE